MDFRIKKLDFISSIKNLTGDKNIDKANLLINKITNLSNEEFESVLEANNIKSNSDVMNFISNYLGITSLKITALDDLNIDDTFFHFTNAEHIRGIETDGMNAQIGERSSGLEKDKMYFFSRGKSVLQTTDVWIKWIMQRAFGEKNAFGFYDNLEETTVRGMQQHWYRMFLDGSYLYVDKRKNAIFPLVYEGMKERKYLALDLEEGRDFCHDAIDVKKQRALENKEKGNDTDYKFMKTMYGKYSQVNSPIVDNWNFSSLPNKHLPVEKISLISSSDGHTDMLHIFIEIYNKMRDTVEYDLLDEFVTYAKIKMKEELNKNKNETKIIE